MIDLKNNIVYYKSYYGDRCSLRHWVVNIFLFADKPDSMLYVIRLNFKYRFTFLIYYDVMTIANSRTLALAIFYAYNYNIVRHY